MTQTQTLTTRPVLALIRELAIPASVGFFFNTLFNAVDTWWGGQISTQALAAVAWLYARRQMKKATNP